MKLIQLFSSFSAFRLGDSHEDEVTIVTSDSRSLQDGGVFVAIKGISADGHSFIEKAVSNFRLAGLVVEDESKIPADFRGAVLVVEDSTMAFHRLAAKFQGNPANDLFCVGVTGTNGKTTCTYLIEAVLNEFSWDTGVMGTVDHHLKDKVWKSQLTTPDAYSLHMRLREFRDLGAQAVAMEVSSHALDQKRVGEIPFSVGVFTNLTRDHLDYHKTMEEYFAAKELLFSHHLGSKKSPLAIIYGDDQWGKKLKVDDRAKKVFFGFESSNDIKVSISKMDFSKTHFTVTFANGSEDFESPLVGRFNVLNSVAAILVGQHAGATMDTCKNALKKFMGVPGRLERVDTDTGINVFVDYAHTPDALEKALGSLQEIRSASSDSDLKKAKIICVFGCGGDRDKGKRPEMGKIAEEGADLIYVTSDNPRSEDPQAILNDIVQGVSDTQKIVCEVDRSLAIRKSIEAASKGDVILIAGKGHEDYQIVGDQTLSFDDRIVAKEVLNER